MMEKRDISTEEAEINTKFGAVGLCGISARRRGITAICLSVFTFICCLDYVSSAGITLCSPGVGVDRQGVAGERVMRLTGGEGEEWARRFGGPPKDVLNLQLRQKEERRKMQAKRK